jgi:glycine oxidase
VSAPGNGHGSDVVVVGGGVIGLAIAWRAALAGLSVTCVDPKPGGGASWAAAGLLAPVTEVHYGEDSLLKLNLASADRYPSFVAELDQATGLDVGYRQCGTLAVALDGDDKVALDELDAFHQRLGLKSERLTGGECRRLEPLLAPVIRGGLLVHGDHQVDNRRLCHALLRAVASAGVTLMASTASAIVVEGNRVTGVRSGDGAHIPTGQVVLAAGCWSASVLGLPSDAVPQVRPVKGQLLRLQAPVEPPLLSRNLRCLVAGSHVYLVPRANGEIVVGATVEEQGFDITVTAGAIRQLLHDAWQVLPAISELQLVETHAGLRPGSPDNAPMLGVSPSVEGLVIATGHFRNGILLTPVTADAIAELLLTGLTPDIIRPFIPGRVACA